MFVAVIWPKPAFTFAAAVVKTVSVVEALAMEKLGVFVKLKLSARNCRCIRSFRRGKSFIMDRSKCMKGGP